MIIDDLIIYFADIAADAALGKDLSKHEHTIKECLSFIASHLIANSELPVHPQSRDLMEIGYWLFVYRDSIQT